MIAFARSETSANLEQAIGEYSYQRYEGDKAKIFILNATLEELDKHFKPCNYKRQNGKRSRI